MRCALLRLRGARTTAFPSRLPLLRGSRWPLAGALSASPADAQATDVKMGAGTIDVHHHYFPPATQEATFQMLTGGFGEVPERIRNWSPARAVEDLDR